MRQWWDANTHTHTLPGPGQAHLRNIANYVRKAATPHCSHTCVPKTRIWGKPNKFRAKEQIAALIGARRHNNEFSYRKAWSNAWGTHTSVRKTVAPWGSMCGAMPPLLQTLLSQFQHCGFLEYSCGEESWLFLLHSRTEVCNHIFKPVWHLASRSNGSLSVHTCRCCLQ